jgi:hypothetical protein
VKNVAIHVLCVGSLSAKCCRTVTMSRHTFHLKRRTPQISYLSKDFIFQLYALKDCESHSLSIWKAIGLRDARGWTRLHSMYYTTATRSIQPPSRFRRESPVTRLAPHVCPSCVHPSHPMRAEASHRVVSHGLVLCWRTAIWTLYRPPSSSVIALRLVRSSPAPFSWTMR